MATRRKASGDTTLPVQRLGQGAFPLLRPQALPRWILHLPLAVIARVSLFQRFMLLSLAILVVGAFVIGNYVAGEIKSRVIHRTSALTALYVDSFISPHLQELAQGDTISETHFGQLDGLLASSSLGQKIVSFKVWNRAGQVLYATDRRLVGQQFPLGVGLSKALAGQIYTSISGLAGEENRYERLRWGRLLETYAPVHAFESGALIGASEFYQDPSELESEISDSQRKGWLIVGTATSIMYLMLVGMVRGASNTIARQHRGLAQLAQENAALAARVRRAAAQRSETDERLLMRIAQDLHDGPAQDVSLALLRLESLGQDRRRRAASGAVDRDFQLVQTALTSALREIRQISAGLRMPELQNMSLSQVVERAVHDHQEKTGSTVQLQIGEALPAVAVPMKIAVFRLIQEALNNAYRHGGVAEQTVVVSHRPGLLLLEISDRGAGFDPISEARPSAGSAPLGLRGMRERVEMLGGTFQVTSRRHQGTTVRATIPLEWGDE